MQTLFVVLPMMLATSFAYQNVNPLRSLPFRCTLQKSRSTLFNNVFPVNSVHHGFHYSRELQKLRPKSFFEGWYYRMSVPETKSSQMLDVVLVTCIQRTKHNGDYLVSLQTIINNGEDDVYLLRSQTHNSSTINGIFSASFQQNHHSYRINFDDNNSSFVDVSFDSNDNSVGTISGYIPSLFVNDASTVLKQTPPGTDSLNFTFPVTVKNKWGSGKECIPTSGWISKLSRVTLFDPHWQVLSSRGSVDAGFNFDWKRGGSTMRALSKTKENITNTKFYAEKNWGVLGFPPVWFWVQANQFNSHDSLAVTIGGGEVS